jgi:hypothetical protein
MKLVQERAENILELIDIGNDFLHRTQNGSATKRKDWQTELHEIKKLYNKRNGHPIGKAAHGMGEIFASYKTDKGLITRIYKQLKKLTS